MLTESASRCLLEPGVTDIARACSYDWTSPSGQALLYAMQRVAPDRPTLVPQLHTWLIHVKDWDGRGRNEQYFVRQDEDGRTSSLALFEPNIRTRVADRIRDFDVSEERARAVDAIMHARAAAMR